MGISSDSTYEVSSSNNSSTSNINAGASFTGTADRIDTYDAVHVSLFATQNCTIQVQQSSNGTNWDLSDSFTSTANVGFSTTVAAVTSFLRVIVTNNGGSATTSLRLQTQFTASAAVSSRSLGQKTSQESKSVVIASDQSAVPVSQSGTWTVEAIPSTDGIQTYSASAVFAAASLATDVFTITGSATRTVRVMYVFFCMTATAGSNPTVLLVRRSTANSGGTSATPTVIPFDTTNAAGTAVVRNYTANPTLGTSAGNVYSTCMYVSGGGTAGSIPFVYDAAGAASQSITLRGTSQVLAVNLNGVTFSGNSCRATVVWTEE